VFQPLDAVVIRLAGGLLGTGVRDLIAGDALLRRAPAVLDLDSSLPLAMAATAFLAYRA